ncbi:NAD(P)-binding protein [Aspergillus uvarum CBS 121591]|uniref:NAD(P)-binding protein n=1 Tax=Aspergillus uvarum CBS 121591 TaxID=1448315 RepID=A0A319DP21_9EURO|nr:NAD(P)-binding protein [Aspergillus uvarum CBS 121591]PYH81052.1 NAD(P)-binding protein [Aspergillus uvarum CBS 121591]
MRALVTIEGGKAEIQKVPVPQPLPGHALIKVNATAQSNDLNGIALAKPGVVCGDDFAGTVVDPNGTSLRKGQRVAGFVMGSDTNPPRGTFAQYAMVHPDYIFAVPDSVSDTAAASISLSLATATVSLNWLELPNATDPVDEPFPIFIYGASSSVGLFAVQLAKMANLFVIATASKRNHDLVRGYGADVVIDYRDVDWVEQVQRAANQKLRHVFDTISTYETTKAAVRTLSPAGGHIVCIMARTAEEIGLPPGVNLNVALCYSVFGENLRTKDDVTTWKKYLKHLPAWLESKALIPNPLWEFGGLDDILEGLAVQQKGGVSGQKIVYSIV